MRLWVLAVVGCMGCASSSAKPGVSTPQHGAALAEPTEVERRPYAELVAPAAPEAAESPGIWLEIAQPDRLVKLLPDSIQARPGVRAIADIGLLASGAFGADVGAVIDLSQPLELATSIDSVGLQPQPVFAFRVRSPKRSSAAKPA